MTVRAHTISSVVLDVDGVIWIAGAPSAGAILLLDTLRTEGVPFCLLTNDCSVSKSERHAALRRAGFAVAAEQLATAAETTGEWLAETSARVIMYLGSPGAMLDVAKGLSIREDGPVDAVVVGDLFEFYDRRLVDNAARAIVDGAQLVAMQRNRRWSDGVNWHVDNGFWVAGLEYVTGQQALVTGKPSRGAYMTALRRLGQESQDYSSTAFVSDDIVSDLRGAKELGLITVYFGEAGDVPTWVDYHVHSMKALHDLLFGGRHD
jgi:HAD superfamily hydrolase (TIGR01450 family)